MKAIQSFTYFLFYLSFFFMQFSCVFSSIINPDLAPQMPGYKKYARGRDCFQKKLFNKAEKHFSQAIENCYQPCFFCEDYCNVYIDSSSGNFSLGDSLCDGIPSRYSRYNEPESRIGEEFVYFNRNYMPEIKFAIYRHSHFYVGLIHLEKEEFLKAHHHFRKAIGFGEDEVEMKKLTLDEDDEGDNAGGAFYRCFNIIDPSWITLTALTSLYQEKYTEAQQLILLGFGTWESIVYIAIENDLSFSDECEHFQKEEMQNRYWKDWENQGLTQESWSISSSISLHVAASIVDSAQGNLKKALDHASKAIDLKDCAIKDHVFAGESPDHHVLYSNRGVLYMQMGQYDAAMSDFTHAIELNGSDPINYFYRGQLYLLFENYHKALDDYNQAIAFNPHDTEFYRQRALVHALSGSWDEAVADLSKHERRDRPIKLEQNERGLDEFSKGLFKNAISRFSQYIQLNPKEAAGYQNRAAAYLQDDQVDKALKDIQTAIQINPKDFTLYQMRAHALMTTPSTNETQEREFLEEAKKNLLTALELNGEEASIHQDLATTYSLLQNPNAAINSLEQALVYAHPEDRSRILKSLSNRYYENGEFEKALLHCGQAIQSGCKEDKIYLLQGLCLFEEGQFEEAIASYDLALKAGSDPIDIYFVRAQAYFCLHQFEHALEDLSRAIEADPNNAALYQLRGLIYLRSNREQDAYLDFRLALKFQTQDLAADKPHGHNSKALLAHNVDNPFFDLYSCLPCSMDPFFDRLTLTTGLHEGKIFSTLSQINPGEFSKGLASGLLHGGVEVIQEIGPFLAQLVFHPLETSEVLIDSFTVLFSHALKEEWEEVCEALVPELKELFTKWDKIDDYEKGRLTGTFIGKNGVAVLTAIGAAKTLSKLKGAVHLGKTQFSHNLKNIKPAILGAPSTEFIPQLPLNQPLRLPYPGGSIAGLNEGKNALARMVNYRSDFLTLLETKGLKKAQEAGLACETWAEVETWAKLGAESRSLTPRVIPPSILEVKMTNPVTAGINLVINNKIKIKNLNDARHILQKKHGWDKVLELSGNVEKDIQKVLDFIEKKEIVTEKYFKRITEFSAELPVKRTHILEYEATIAGQKIEVFIQKNLATEELFLNNGWIARK